MAYILRSEPAQANQILFTQTARYVINAWLPFQNRCPESGESRHIASYASYKAKNKTRTEYARFRRRHSIQQRTR